MFMKVVLDFDFPWKQQTNWTVLLQVTHTASICFVIHESTTDNPNFVNPFIVTLNYVYRIHVRRTDKRAEAKYHDIEEYMTHVSYRWFVAF